LTCFTSATRFGSAFVVALVIALGLRSSALAQDPPAPPASPAPGEIHVIVFTGVALRLVQGASVKVEGGASAATDHRGSAFLSAPAGEHVLRIEVPRDRLSGKEVAGQGVVRVPDVGVASGDRTRVLVTISADGKLEDADVIVPKPAVTEAPTAEAEAATAVPAGPEGATGTVSGRITSAADGKPVAGAKLYVIGFAAEAETDAEGRFSLALPEGSYSLSIAHLEYTGQTLEGVIASVGGENKLEIKLEPAPIEMEDFVVRGRRIRGSVASVMEERRSATTVTDAIGAEDIRKSPDGTASAATRRVVGATVVGGQYLFVRGLGGRYSNVRLNDVPLPSTDPDVPGFQLDLFPASLLSSLTIVKTFTPDMPGDFAGGSMNIGTRDFPDRFDLSASLSVAGNTQTLGHKVLTYDGGDFDFLGFDDGTRALPDEVPGTYLQRLGIRGMELKERIIEISRSFPNHWKRDAALSPPQIGLGFSVGNTTRIGSHRAGYLFTLGYRYNVSRATEKLTTTSLPDGETLTVRDRLEREIGRQEAQIGMLGSVSYDLAEGHQLRLVSLLTQTADDKTALVTGFSEPEGGPIRQTELKFVERRLLFNQLLGNHDFSAVLLDWQLNSALVARDQPDTRSVLYRSNAQGDFIFRDAGGSGEHAYADLGQLDVGGGTNLTVPIDETRLKTGYLGRLSNRDFTARRFGSQFTGDSSYQLLPPPEEIFTPENADEVWKTNEASAPTDGYDAKQVLNAGYGMAELPVAAWLKLTGGARVEAFHQELEVVTPADNFQITDLPSVHRTDVDVLPSGGTILTLSDAMSVRLAYGGTVARPLLREISPAASQDFVRRRTIQGNPDLKRTYIQNFDVRWELFPTKTEVVAISGFYKRFRDAIETVVKNDGGDLSYQNTKGAYAYGAEVEGRFGLGYLAEALEDLTFGANFALIRSRVELAADVLDLATSKERPLSGQSPFVVNLTLGYSPADTGLSLNVFYNVFGRRIQEVGIRNKPDVYEEPVHSLDFTASYQLDAHWTIGATATNLLFQDSVVREGEFEFSRIEKGSSFGVRLGFAN
jgi:hypothetical protein